MRADSVTREAERAPFCKSHETMNPARSMQVVWVVGPENCVKHRKGPKPREDLVVTIALFCE